MSASEGCLEETMNEAEEPELPQLGELVGMLTQFVHPI